MRLCYKINTSVSSQKVVTGHLKILELHNYTTGMHVYSKYNMASYDLLRKRARFTELVAQTK